eukprot:scaffold2180_cov137-Isochrysis_galbana.AAC.1
MCISNLNLQPSTCRLPPAAVPPCRGALGRPTKGVHTQIQAVGVCRSHSQKAKKAGGNGNGNGPGLNSQPTGAERERCSEVRRLTGIPGFHYA